MSQKQILSLKPLPFFLKLQHMQLEKSPYTEGVLWAWSSLSLDKGSRDSASARPCFFSLPVGLSNDWRFNNRGRCQQSRGYRCREIRDTACAGECSMAVIAGNGRVIVGSGDDRRLFGVKPLLNSMLTYCQLVPLEQTWVELESNFILFFQEYAFENVVCKMTGVLLRFRYVNYYAKITPRTVFYEEWQKFAQNMFLDR